MGIGKPEYLFRFVSLSGKRKDTKKKLYSLKNNYIWFSDPAMLNDPFECKALLVDYDQLLKEGRSKEEVDEVKYMLERMCLIASFTDNIETNLPMWAYYANNHGGFCIKYKVEKPEKIFNVDCREQREPATETIKKLLDAYNIGKDQTKSIEEQGRAQLIMQLSIRVLRENYRIKHLSWAHENEYRAIHMRDKSDLSAGKNVPADEVGLTIVAIYTGVNCCYHGKIKKIADRLNVPCMKCKVDEKKFLLVT